MLERRNTVSGNNGWRGSRWEPRHVRGSRGSGGMEEVQIRKSGFMK
jgi:hypothetical protein